MGAITEDKARTLWCPASRLVQEPGAQYPVTNRNEMATYPAAVFCIGSACMAWRWQHQWLDNAQQEPPWVNYAPYAFEPGEGQERDVGFCGLAGQP